jgi:hypothetical protein
MHDADKYTLGATNTKITKETIYKWTKASTYWDNTTNSYAETLAETSNTLGTTNQ